MHTILEILFVSVKEGTSKTGPRAGQPWKIPEAHCVLRKEDGSASGVGVLVVPKALEELAKPGTYTATFSLEAPTYGEAAGKIVATLAGLVPVPPEMFKGMVVPNAQRPSAPSPSPATAP